MLIWYVISGRCCSIAFTYISTSRLSMSLLFRNPMSCLKLPSHPSENCTNDSSTCNGYMRSYNYLAFSRRRSPLIGVSFSYCKNHPNMADSNSVRMTSLFHLLDFCVASAARSKSESLFNPRRVWETALWLMDRSKDRSNLIHVRG